MNDFLPFTRPDIDEATIQSVTSVLRSGWITTGPKAMALEQALSDYFGKRPVCVFNSGTGTLEVALRMIQLQAGDEVITTPLTWVATANTILNAGGTPVFVDIDPVTRNIDLNLIEAAITPRTRAIMPVDLAGLPVNRDQLYAIAARYHLRVIEDAAQSMGALWNGKRIGSFGDLVSISFHANKNMNTIEGGALVLNTEEEARECEKWRLQGVTRFPDGNMDVDRSGGKYNMTDVSAAVGLGQLSRLASFNTRRRELAKLYFKQINPAIGLDMPLADFENSNWHMFQPLLPLSKMKITRSEFVTRMKEKGIGIGIHYPALHLFTLYRELGFKEGTFPHAEHVGASTITLPLFPAMKDEDVGRVCTALHCVLQ